MHFLYLGLTQKELDDAVRSLAPVWTPGPGSVSTLPPLRHLRADVIRVCVLASAWAVVSFSSFQAQRSDGTQ